MLHAVITVHNFFTQVFPADDNFVIDPLLPYSINGVRILDFYIPTSFYLTNVAKNVEN
jgi:hypothetical protein